MKFRERLNAVLHGGVPDKVPFAPYDVLAPRGEFVRGLMNDGMGLLSRRETVKSWCPNVSIEQRTESDRVSRTYYNTPLGSVSTAFATGQDKLANSGSVQTEWMIKKVEDFAPVIFMVEDTRFAGNDAAFINGSRELGSDGLVRGTGPHAPYDASEHLFGLENWSYMQHDHPKEFGNLLDAMEERERRMLPFILESQAEFIAFGSVSGSYSPAAYAKYALPFYQEYVPKLLAGGKIPALHAHNENLEVFADAIAATGVPVIEAYTPPPCSDLSLPEARAAWGDDTVIWVNFPETVFYSGPEEVRSYTRGLLRSDPAPHRLVIGFTEMGMWGVSDDYTERVFKEGFLAISECVNEFEPALLAV